MRSMHGLDTFTWARKGEVHELTAHGEIVATLAIRSSWGTFATAEASDGAWTFKRVGFWSPRVTVHVLGGNLVGMFSNDTWDRGGTLQLAAQSFRYETKGFWTTSWTVQTADGAVLLTFIPRGDTTDVTLPRLTGGPFRAAHLRELSLLTCLGMYLAIMSARDDEATALATATTAITNMG